MRVASAFPCSFLQLSRVRELVYMCASASRNEFKALATLVARRRYETFALNTLLRTTKIAQSENLLAVG